MTDQKPQGENKRTTAQIHDELREYFRLSQVALVEHGEDAVYRLRHALTNKEAWEGDLTRILKRAVQAIVPAERRLVHLSDGLNHVLREQTTDKMLQAIDELSNLKRRTFIDMFHLPVNTGVEGVVEGLQQSAEASFINEDLVALREIVADGKAAREFFKHRRTEDD